jgi:hypothetical protein
MSTQKELLAYCGIYCADCLGCSGVIAGAAENLLGVLTRYKFERTANAVFPEQLSDYDRFRQMLGFMATLRCPARCRKDESPAASNSCKVRACCREHGFFACFECEGFEECETLRSNFGGLHARPSIANLKAIKEMGLDTWLQCGERHHYWDETGTNDLGR